ncbi:MAG: hypothetical protein DLM72_17760 [Candidatus Nitrosopolaris wilkensis]|nr:MAG: hypothetical protein DLM72_17760 [Candidatus Nitrosopolaris wilkensis]
MLLELLQLYTSVNERIKEIGTMKAIGAKPWFILSMFLSEAVLIGLIGSTLGIFTGVDVAYLLTSGFGASGQDHQEQQLLILPLSFFQMTFFTSGFSHYP